MKLRSDTITAILTIALAFKASMNATAVEVAATVDPILSGTGPNLTARFPNVASVDGQNVDLYGQILSQTTNKTNTFWQGPPWGLPGDFVFQFLEGVPGEVRSATVRWTFYLSGTNTPISVSGLSLTIERPGAPEAPALAERPTVAPDAATPTVAHTPATRPSMTPAA